jgi:hypothetical protein
VRPRTLLSLSAFLLACSNVTETNGVISWDVLAPLNPSVEVGDTLHFSARALDRDGNEVPTAPIVWRTPDTTLAVDSVAGVVTGLIGPATGRVQAQTGNLASNFVTVTIQARPDTLILEEPDTLRIATGIDTSPPLMTLLVSYSSGDTAAVAGGTIIYEIIEPVFPMPADQTVELPGGVVLDTVTTGADGKPSPEVTLSRVTGMTQPDSAIVEIRAFRTRGTIPVPGSGQRFIVRIEP